MKYPHRAQQHVSEARSMNILHYLLPGQWIIRQVTERDYGIDLYLEIIEDDQLVTGKMVLLQVKSEPSIVFHDSVSSVGGIKESTCNYWKALPVPVFIVVVDLLAKSAYWVCASWELRFDHDFKGHDTRSFRVDGVSAFDEQGLRLFKRAYNRERRWHRIEGAIISAILSYKTLGPLVLHCTRMTDNMPVSSPVNALLTQHYQNFEVLVRALTDEHKSTKLGDWWKASIEFSKSISTGEPRMYYHTAKEIITYFVPAYWATIRTAVKLVMSDQSVFWSERWPWLVLHLEHNKLLFNELDWFARYFYDEYENETANLEQLLLYEPIEHNDLCLADDF